MRVACYVRVSTQEQNTELQERELRAYCDARGWTEVSMYADKATGTNARRPELQRLLSDVRDGSIDVVVCWKLDRLFRSLKDLLITLQEFEACETQFVCLKDNIDLTTPAGRLLMQILGAVAEFEASMIRERVSAGLRNARTKGVRLGPPTRLDYERIRELARTGHGIDVIAELVGGSKSGVRRVLLLQKYREAVA